MNYPSRIPESLDAGEVLVHNGVRPTRRQGTRGFRFWTQAPTPELVLCDCAWAGLAWLCGCMLGEGKRCPVEAEDA